MSEEFKLPNALDDLESKLRSISLPDLQVKRDEVLYQAGYAAAIAELNNASTPARNDISSRTWPISACFFAALSAALAAVLLFPNLLVQNNSTSPVATVETTADPVDSSSTVSVESANHKKDSVDSEPIRQRQPKRNWAIPRRPAVWEHGQSPIAMLMHADQFDWSSTRPPQVTVVYAEPKTRHQLLEQYLKEHRRPMPSDGDRL